MPSRRRFLGLSAGALGSFLLNPARIFGWGAVKGAAPTHQQIQRLALQILSEDPVMILNAFPAHAGLIDNDYVFPKIGTGPDMEGTSNYSWHYYNPARNKGRGPWAVYQHLRHFIRSCRESLYAPETTKFGAWAAHFLADMHVPYHVVGIPAEEAFDRVRFNDNMLDADECGPEFLYRLVRPPIGWGGVSNFQDALQYFVKKHPLDGQGRVGSVDWFDPWYYNGVGSGIAPQGFKDMFTGSHASWEFNVGAKLSDSALQNQLKTLMMERYYDPLWKNVKYDLAGTDPYWEPISKQAEEYAAGCAAMTRRDIRLLLDNPEIGVARAVRAVLTLYRASISAITIRPEVLPAGNGKLRLICPVINNDPNEILTDVDVKCTITDGAVQRDNIKHFPQDIPPGQVGVIDWVLNLPHGKSVDAVFRASGLYRFTPDIGYAAKTIRADGVGGTTEESQSLESPWHDMWITRESHMSGRQRPLWFNTQTSIMVKGDKAILNGVNQNPYNITGDGRCIYGERNLDNFMMRINFCFTGQDTFAGTVDYYYRDGQTQTRVDGRRK